jgi:hypothetical protein
MKKLFAFLASWFCFIFGDLFSRVMTWFDNETWCSFWYVLYNNFMLASVAIQDWANANGPAWPWQPAT